MSTLEWFRLVSATTLTAAAILTTWSAVRWAHPLIRPGMRYTATITWVVAVYRWLLLIGRFNSSSPFDLFIRLFANVAFVAVAVAFILHALATKEFKRMFLVSKDE